MIYTLNIYRYDRRCKTGERFIKSYEFDRQDDNAMRREILELRVSGYPYDDYRIDFAPKFKTVINHMTGKEVQIDANTPRCCDPSSELYWSM